MEKTVMVLLVSNRHQSAAKVQEILTNYGCHIKTRLGVHDGVLNQCSEAGLIMLELVGDKSKIKEMDTELQKLKGISVKMIQLSVEV